MEPRVGYTPINPWLAFQREDTASRVSWHDACVFDIQSYVYMRILLCDRPKMMVQQVPSYNQ